MYQPLSFSFRKLIIVVHLNHLTSIVFTNKYSLLFYLYLLDFPAYLPVGSKKMQGKSELIMEPSQTYKRRRSSPNIIRINGLKDRKKTRRARIRMTKCSEKLNRGQKCSILARRLSQIKIKNALNDISN